MGFMLIRAVMFSYGWLAVSTSPKAPPGREHPGDIKDTSKLPTPT